MTTADFMRWGETLAAIGAAWLLTYALHSSVLIGGTWALQRFGFLRSLRLRDLAWRGALLGGLLTASLQLGMGLAPWGFTLSAKPLPTATLAALQPDEPAGAVRAPTADVALSDTESKDVLPLIVRAADTTVESPDAAPAADSAPLAAVAVPRVRVSSLFFMAWVAASAVLLLRLAVARARVLDGLGQRIPVQEASVRAQLDRLCEEAGRYGHVQLTTAEGLKSPVALGWSEICLPRAALDELDASQQRSVLAHELAHIQRKDPLWLLLGTTLEQLLFFQPLNRLARRNMQEVAEYLCDDWAAVADGSGLPIARGLASVARWLEGEEERGVPLAGMAERPSLLVARVQRLLDATAVSLEPRRSWHLFALGLVLVLTMVLVPGVRAAPAVGWFEGSGESASIQDAKVETDEPAAKATTQFSFVTADSPAPPSAVHFRSGGLQRDRDVARGGSGSQVFVAQLAPVAPPAPEAPEAPRAMPAPAPTPSYAAHYAGPNTAWVLQQQKYALQAQKMAMKQVRMNLGHTHVNVHVHGRGHSHGGTTSSADAATVDALVKALKDADAGVREAAAESLGRLSDSRAQEGLMAAASDSEARVRLAAVEALTQLEDNRSIPVYAKALKDTNTGVRRAAAEALASLDDAPQTVEPLVSALSDTDVHVRLAAVQGLSARKDKRALSALGSLAKDSSAEVRAAAVAALGDMEDVSAVPALTLALKDDNVEVRTQAVRALGSLGSPKATGALIEATRDRSGEVRAQAAAALSETHDASNTAVVVGALKALLDDPSSEVREQAVNGLSEIRDASSLQALIAALQSKDPVVRKAAAAALGQRD
jgi:HEAT repeat protein/Zn-dependent protease with chaperone function